jgi:enamine deaminase RidA (YjgF/YER057c/UK114 family)
MSYTTTKGLILNSILIYPDKKGSLVEQLTDCYRQFNENSGIKSPAKFTVVKQTIFINAKNNHDYNNYKNNLTSCAVDFFKHIPPTSIIAQTPENGSLVLELTTIEGLQENEILRRTNHDSNWMVIRRNELKMIIATGSGENTGNNDILESSISAFNKIDVVLQEENMKFSNILRQWNYIEQITGIETRANSTSQHYQIFNDVRSKFYNQCEFVNGFPAATGIGTDCGGITIDIIAAEFNHDCSVIPIKSPVQLDAYSYSKEVLAENNTMSDFCRTSPKFERAKIFVTPDYEWVFISGTAAIKGQVSIPVISAEIQTDMTIQNILSLISDENLRKHGIAKGKRAEINHLRVYVKHPTDMKAVKDICMKYFPDIPSVFIVADICRPELLVEIEGLAIIQ